MISRLFLALSLSVALCACKIQIGVPYGGEVVSKSGLYICTPNSPCIIDIEDYKFDESFEAIVIDDGYEFMGWRYTSKDDQVRLCGGRKGPCEIATTNIKPSFSIKKILQGDSTYYLAPHFKRIEPREGEPVISENLVSACEDAGFEGGDNVVPSYIGTYFKPGDVACGVVRPNDSGADVGLNTFETDCYTVSAKSLGGDPIRFDDFWPPYPRTYSSETSIGRSFKANRENTIRIAPEGKTGTEYAVQVTKGCDENIFPKYYEITIPGVARNADPEGQTKECRFEGRGAIKLISPTELQFLHGAIEFNGGPGDKKGCRITYENYWFNKAISRGYFDLDTVPVRPLEFHKPDFGYRFEPDGNNLIVHVIHGSGEGIAGLILYPDSPKHLLTPVCIGQDCRN